MILIADSGSTKTDWAIVDGMTVLKRVKTEGINPFHQSEEKIRDIISSHLLPEIDVPTLSAIFFYGSGCTPEIAPKLRAILAEYFPEAADIECNGDLLAAARAVCGRNPGVACILGTGANSCLYDGSKIIANTPPLGYILGDEGSGAVLGQLFLNAIFKGFLPLRLRDEYLEWSHQTYAGIIHRVYCEPQANKYLAGIANFVAGKQEEYPELKQMVIDNFRHFFDRNLIQYSDKVNIFLSREDSAVRLGFVGGIAYQFSALLSSVAEEKGYTITRIMKSPIDGLIRFHEEE